MRLAIAQPPPRRAQRTWRRKCSRLWSRRRRAAHECRCDLPRTAALWALGSTSLHVLQQSTRPHGASLGTSAPEGPVHWLAAEMVPVVVSSRAGQGILV